METGEKVGRDAAIRDTAPDCANPVKIPFAGVFTVHRFQHRVTTRLHRQMDMVAYIRISGNNVDGAVAHIFWM